MTRPSPTRLSATNSGSKPTLLADFEPKGAVASAYGAYIDGYGTANRSLVLIDAEGYVEWVYESDTPLEIPSPKLILENI